MRICHLCLNGPYNEGWNYQENILPKYHALQGNDVYQIVTPYIWEGTQFKESTDKEYINEHGVHIYRCYAKKGLIGGIRFNRYPEVYSLLEKINPEILFIHDVQCLDMSTVAKYLKKHPHCIVYADNHSDFSNSARNWVSKNIIHKIIWKRMANIIEPYVKKFYGVLPARVDFLIDVYGLPKDKVELLVMGADDEIVNDAVKLGNITKTRREFNISEKDFLIVTGGKINSSRPETIELMKAVSEINIPNIKLLVFGTASNELKAEFDKCCSLKNIVYAGWQESRKTYYLMAAADLIVFPGLHSVMWEQTVAVGVPGLFRKISGFEHIDVGGNVQFLKETSKECLKTTIEQLIQDKQGLKKMKKVAVEKGMKMFSYNEISKRSIE